MPIDEIDIERDPEGYVARAHDVGRSDPRWPTRCRCGYVFEPDDEWQTRLDDLWVCRDPNRPLVTSLPAAPPGAMWHAFWMPESYRGPDGLSLVVKTPDGYEWMIDGRANNCTMPNDNAHKCWVRHGIPPKITVDKNGLTCAAGAGSIVTPRYHGFLRNGAFT